MSGELVGGWGELAVALFLFLASHAVPARPPVRRRLVALTGERVYLVLYSIVSLLLLAWLIAASARAPFVPIWTFEEWQRLVPAMAMPIACVLLVFAFSSPNPLSLRGRSRAAFDPEQPGIAGVVRHPVLWAALLWSISHMTANGDLAHLLLFGLFALLSIVGMLALDRRGRRRLGTEEWQRLTQRSSNIPLWALGAGWRPRPGIGELVRVAAGLLLYALLIATHAWFAGVPALIG